MNGSAFLDELRRAGLNQVGFARLVAHLSAGRLGNTTVNRWIHGRRPVPALAVAALRLFARLPAPARWELIEASQSGTNASQATDRAND